MDTNQQRGHYDLLIPTCQPGASSLPPTTAHSTVSSISFDQFLHNTFPLAADTSTPTLPKNNNSSCTTKETSACSSEEIKEAGGNRKVVDEPDQQQHHSENSPDSDENKFPSIWTPKQADEFQKDHPWLLFSNGCLGCRTCKQVKNFGVFKTQGIKTSKRWLECCVTFNGKTRQTQLSSLRKRFTNMKKGNSIKWPRKFA